MATVLEKEIIKTALRELFIEEPDTIKAMLKDIILEEQLISNSKFDELLNKNFNRFDETFRALA
jgi:hypothetical protein